MQIGLVMVVGGGQKMVILGGGVMVVLHVIETVVGVWYGSSGRRGRRRCRVD